MRATTMTEAIERKRNDGLKRDCSRKRRARAPLRPQWETDNFCCSHCCTSDVHFGQGRVGALTSTRPAKSIGSFTSLPSTALAPIVVGLVLPNLLHVVQGPEPDVDTAKRLNGRRLNLSFSNPAVKGR